MGADVGVVKELIGQGDDGLQPVVFDDPATDFAFAAFGTVREAGRAVEYDADAPVLLRLELGDHVLQKKQRPIRDAGQAHAKGRIGEHVVERAATFSI